MKKVYKVRSVQTDGSEEDTPVINGASAAAIAKSKIAAGAKIATVYANGKPSRIYQEGRKKPLSVRW